MSLNRQDFQRRMQEMGCHEPIEQTFIGQFLMDMNQHHRSIQAMIWGHIRGSLGVTLLTSSSVMIVKERQMGAGEAVSFPLYLPIHIKNNGTVTWIQCSDESWELHHTLPIEVAQFERTLAQMAKSYPSLNRAG